MKRPERALLLAALAGCWVICVAETSAVAPSVVATRDNGTIVVPQVEVPLSSYMSEAAKRRVIDESLHPPSISGSNIEAVRKSVDAWYGVRVTRARSLYRVDIREERIAGVHVSIVTPANGVPVRNQHRVLINVHGGGFVVGAGQGALAESIPIAALGGFKVVSVDYRMAPEFHFPAASEDVAAVFRALLDQYPAANMGIYGCSAGGLLTAEALAWLQKEGLPAPGAVGIFCVGADAAFGGDSRFIAASLDVALGRPPSPPPAAPNPPLFPMEYFQGADLRDPLVSPLFSPAVLKRFPATLLITGSRDLGMSSIVHTHAELIAAGVDADLHVWEGMGHNFLVEMDLPESRAAYAVIARHFDRHLGLKR